MAPCARTTGELNIYEQAPFGRIRFGEIHGSSF